MERDLFFEESKDQSLVKSIGPFCLNYPGR